MSRGGWGGQLAGVLVGLAVVAFGGIFAGIGWLSVSTSPETDRTTSGEVLEIERKTNDDGGTTCRARARFVVDGRDYVAHTNVGSSGMCDHAAGDAIEVRYSSVNPTVNEVGMRQSNFGWIFVAVGAVPMAIGLLIVAASVYGGFARSRNPDATDAEPPAWVIKALQRMPEKVPVRDPGFAPPVTDEDAIAPGWYPTPDGRHERWHNGMVWTENVRPAAPADDSAPAHPTD